MDRSVTAEPLSPELVLVDPDVAAYARALLADRDESPTSSDEATPFPEATAELLLRRMDEEAAAALQRIIDLSDVEPPAPPRRFRVPKLVGAFATWAVVGILTVEAFRLS